MLFDQLRPLYSYLLADNVPHHVEEVGVRTGAGWSPWDHCRVGGASVW